MEENIGKIVLTIEEYRLKHGISKNKIVLGARFSEPSFKNTVTTMLQESI